MTGLSHHVGLRTYSSDRPHPRFSLHQALYPLLSHRIYSLSDIYITIACVRKGRLRM